MSSVIVIVIVTVILILVIFHQEYEFNLLTYWNMRADDKCETTICTENMVFLFIEILFFVKIFF